MASGYQQLSCSEGGQFDWKRKQNKTWTDTKWHMICKDRAAKGISRKARIRNKA
ncbi:MAG: hypothetical protein AB7J46_06225 [Candidatus Altimarinota bacterium]